MAAKRARESPISHVLVAKATVAKVMLPNNIAVAIVDTGASEAASIRASMVILVSDSHCDFFGTNDYVKIRYPGTPARYSCSFIRLPLRRDSMSYYCTQNIGVSEKTIDTVISCFQNISHNFLLIV